MTLTLCMIVRDEERNLPLCLDSVQGLADETVLVDTGSSDATLRIAADYGAKLLSFDFSTVDFAAARNYCLANASGRWILMLDADETPDPPGVLAIRHLIAQDENAGYYLERHNRGSDSGNSHTDFVLRLFPNRPSYSFRGRVHETIDASILRAGGRLRRTAIRLDHAFAADPEARQRRNFRYIQILLEEIAADPSDATRLDFLAAEYHQLGMFHEAGAIAERIAQIRSGDPRAHLVAGVYHLLYQHNPNRARTDFEQALKLRPGDPEAEYFLAQTALTCA